MVVGDNKSMATKKCRQIDGNIDCHGNAAVRRGGDCPMEHIRGFTGSHWMSLLVKCLRHITPAPAAAMVKQFKSNTENTNNTTFS